MMFRTKLICLACSILLLSVATAAETSVKVATLNCFLLFDPRIDHRGKVDDEERMTDAQYQTKLGNLASLIRGYDVVGLQETGGKSEIAALAERAGMKWSWQRGTDTATGQEVGLIYNLPSWSVSNKGRVVELDRIISKHLLVEARQGKSHVLFLVLHLVRPIGDQTGKHREQISAVGAWMQRTTAANPLAAVVVLGDTNSALTAAGTSLFGIGHEAGEIVGFRSTHLTNRHFDRMVVVGPADWTKAEILRPPFGSRPISELKRVWTDHYLLGAQLVLHGPIR